MWTRMIWLLVLQVVVQCQNGLENNKLFQIFGPPPATNTAKSTAATLSKEILTEIFGTPNVTEAPEKVTLSKEILNVIFTTEAPKKGSVESDYQNAYKPCKMKNDEKGICVPYYLCDLCTDLIIENGKGILDIRGGGCLDALLVCCLQVYVQSNIDLPKEPNSTVDDRDVTDGGSIVDDIDLQTDGPPSKKVAPQTRQCGRMQSNGLAVRIRGNKTSALFGEFPWMVGVLSDESLTWDTTSYLGGGSLISPRAVLTAAHTVLGLLRDEVGLRVRAGEWETKSTWEMYPHVDASVSEGIVHEDFNPGTLYNDIALLILEKPIELDPQRPHIGYACLPPPKSIPPGPPANCYSMGWGSPNEQSNEYAVLLKKIKMPIVPTEACQKNLRTTHLSSHFLLHHSFICAGGKEKQDSCFGDGGSPLVCPIASEKLRVAQVGIVSYGVGCGKGHPGLYTNVANFRGWVDKKMQERKLDTTTYSY